MVRHLGILRFRTSYGQQVLSHSKEVAHLAAMMAAEIGADVRIAKMSGLLHDYLRTVEVRFERGGAGGLPSLPDPMKVVQEFREGGLIALVQTREQRRLLERIQSAMAVIEGYSEHVMDAVGERVLPAYTGLRDSMDRRRRSRSYPERVLQRLLGLDLKMRQYEDGKAFCDRVVERSGIAALNRVWETPEALPTAAELEDPAAWIERTGSRPEPAAA